MEPKKRLLISVPETPVGTSNFNNVVSTPLSTAAKFQLTEEGKVHWNQIQTIISAELEQIKNDEAKVNDELLPNMDDFIERMKSKVFNTTSGQHTLINAEQNSLSPNAFGRRDSPTFKKSSSKLVKIADQIDINVNKMTRDMKIMATKAIEKQIDSSIQHKLEEGIKSSHGSTTRSKHEKKFTFTSQLNLHQRTSKLDSDRSHEDQILEEEIQTFDIKEEKDQKVKP